MNDRDVASVRSCLLDWYDRNRRDLPWRQSTDPYRVWVSEVMLQQTQVRTVVPYFERFIARFPDIAALAGADGHAAIKMWEGLGYYARVRNLQRAARIVVDNGGRIPDDPTAFRELPGVGEYICSAVQSIAFGHPLAVVDGNVKRVLARLFAIGAPVNRSPAHKLFRERADFLLDRNNPSRFNQAMMELGALVCRPTSPDCRKCPLSDHCRAARAGLQEQYPVKEKRPPVPSHRIAVGVVERGNRVLITRRPPEGLLGGLWEFPGGKIEDGETPEAAVTREIKEEAGLDIEVTSFVARVRHAYSHFKVELEVYRCRLRGGAEVHLNGPTDYRWIVREEFENYAFPKANHKFIPFLTEPDTDADSNHE